MTSTSDSPPTVAETSEGEQLRPGGQRVAVLALIGVTAVWGSTFILLKGVVTRVPVADFLATRFWLAALVLVVVAPRAVRRLDRRTARQGVALGVLYGCGQLLQTVGLQHLSASVSGFVTGMYVVFTPVIGALALRQKIGGWVWTAVGVSTAGLAVLSLHGFGVDAGVGLTLLSTVAYALHILGLGAWSRPGHAYGSAVTQTATVAVVCTVGATPGGWTLPSRPEDWAVLVYLAVFAAALALVVQTWAQSRLSATRAAIVMTTEPAWAGVFAVVLGGDPVGWRLVIGGGLVLAAMYLAEFTPRRVGG